MAKYRTFSLVQKAIRLIFYSFYILIFFVFLPFILKLWN
jgi:hypothetical protein